MILGQLRTAPQSCDQTFDSPLNKSLQVRLAHVLSDNALSISGRYPPRRGIQYECFADTSSTQHMLLPRATDTMDCTLLKRWD